MKAVTITLKDTVTEVEFLEGEDVRRYTIQAINYTEASVYASTLAYEGYHTSIIDHTTNNEGM